MPPSTLDRRERHLITRGQCTTENFRDLRPLLIDTVRKAAGAGIDVIHIREKGLAARFVRELAAEAISAVAGFSTRILVNDRFDIALAAGASGVHITSTGLPVSTIRRDVGDAFTIGVSTHTVSEVIAARDDGADYAYFGPIFLTPGKKEPTGLLVLAEVCREVRPFRVIAVGGIDATNIEAVRENGAAGFAAIRYLNDLVCGL